MKRRQLIAGGIIGGGAALAFALPALLGFPAWVAFVTVVIAFLVLGPLYGRITHS